MGWTKPRTWVDGETIIASILNTHIRDNFEFLHRRDRVHAVHTKDAQIKDDEWECLRFDGEAFDNGNMHSGRKRVQRLRVNDNGVYLVIVKVVFEEESAGFRQVMLRVNSDESEASGHSLGTWISPGILNAGTNIHGYKLARLGRGDHINVFVKQNSGAGLRTVSGSETTAAATFVQLTQMGG